MNNKQDRQIRLQREQKARVMFEEAHSGAGEAHGGLWIKVNEAIIRRLYADGFQGSIGGFDDITKGLVSFAARLALDMAKQKDVLP